MGTCCPSGNHSTEGRPRLTCWIFLLSSSSLISRRRSSTFCFSSGESAYEYAQSCVSPCLNAVRRLAMIDRGGLADRVVGLGRRRDGWKTT
jgi:hypothetical protein